MSAYTKILFRFTSLLAFIIAACSNEKSPQELDFESSIFVGDWYSLDEDDNPSILSLNNNHTLSLIRYVDSAGLGKVESKGIWQLANGKYIRYSVVEEGHGITNLFLVQKIDENVLNLFDEYDNASYSLSRITHNIDTFVGQPINDLPESEDAIIEFSNPDMISVTEEGDVIASSPGIVFATSFHHDTRIVTKITINTVSTMFVSDIGNSIDLVKNRFGEPDLEAEFKENMACLWNLNESPIKSVQYQYDSISGQVTRVLTAYHDYDGYDDEATYITGWMPYHDDNGAYFPTPDMFESPYRIDLISASLMISYSDMQYFIANGHFAPPMQ